MQCLLRTWDHKCNYSQTKPIHQKWAEIETAFQWSPALLCNANKYTNIFNLDYSGNREPQTGRSGLRTLWNCTCHFLVQPYYGIDFTEQLHSQTDCVLPCLKMVINLAAELNSVMPQLHKTSSVQGFSLALLFLPKPTLFLTQFSQRKQVHSWQAFKSVLLKEEKHSSLQRISARSKRKLSVKWTQLETA